MSSGPDSDEAIGTLYAHPPAEFVARRDDLVARLRADGDRPGAARVKALRRPSTGAWYLNIAARDGLTSLRELLRLGGRLREAQAGGDFTTLRELAGQRGPLVARVVRDLTAHLAKLGTTATPAGLDEVRATLASALADPEVAEQVTSGRLDRAHHYSGFGTFPAPQPAAAGDSASEPRQAGERSAPEPDEAEAALSAAREEVRLAEDERAGAAAALAVARSAAEAARATVDRLTAELAAATAELAAADAALDQATAAHQRSADRSAAANRRLDTITG